MLVSHEHKFIVALPTKCGTNSMRNMAIAHSRAGHADELQELPKLRHRMDVPEGCEDYARAMVVRNPFSRVVSMYEYLRRHSWEWKYKEITAAEDRLGRRRAWTWFLNMLIDEQVEAAEKDYWKRKLHGKRPYIWTDRMAELMRFLGGTEDGVSFEWSPAPVSLLRLEALAADWAAFTSQMGWELAPMPKRANVTREGDKLHDHWRSYFASEQNRRLGFMFVGEDLDLPFVDRAGV